MSVVEKNQYNSELQAALSSQGLALESLQSTRAELLSKNHDMKESLRAGGIRYQLGQLLGLRYAWDEFFSRLEDEKFLQKPKQS